VISHRDLIRITCSTEPLASLIAFTFLNSLNSIKLDLFFLGLFSILTFWCLIKHKKLLIFIIFFEFIFFWTRNDFHLFIEIPLIEVKKLEINDYSFKGDDFSLLKIGPTLSGYSQLVPKNYPVKYKDYSQKYNFTNFIFSYLISISLTIFIYWKLNQNRVKF